jgi:hypothetical protein
MARPNLSAPFKTSTEQTARAALPISARSTDNAVDFLANQFLHQSGKVLVQPLFENWPHQLHKQLLNGANANGHISRQARKRHTGRLPTNRRHEPVLLRSPRPGRRRRRRWRAWPWRRGRWWRRRNIYFLLFLFIRCPERCHEVFHRQLGIGRIVVWNLFRQLQRLIIVFHHHGRRWWRRGWRGGARWWGRRRRRLRFGRRRWWWRRGRRRWRRRSCSLIFGIGFRDDTTNGSENLFHRWLLGLVLRVTHPAKTRRISTVGERASVWPIGPQRLLPSQYPVCSNEQPAKCAASLLYRHDQC